MMNNKITLITYGDDAYQMQRQILKKTGIHSCFFDQIDVYTPRNIDPTFIKKFDDILTRNRGGGYWIWKPHIVKKALKKCKQDDILIYADAGCLINKDGRQKFSEYISLLKDSKTGSLAFSSNHPEIKYTNSKVLKHFNADKTLQESDQLMATVFLIKKCEHSVDLIEKWNAVLFEDPELFTDFYNNETQHESYIEHRHDQSIFSLIRKIHGSETILSDETYFSNFVSDGKQYPFWGTRLKDSSY